MLMLHDFRVRQRDFLLQISRAMTARLELNEVLRLVLKASTAMLGAEVGLIALLNPAENRYRIRATTGVESDKIAGLNKRLHELVAGALEQQDSQYFDVKLSQMAVALDRRLRQSVALPLVIGGEPVGLLIVFRSHPGMATPDDFQILQSFADQAAIAVYNAQLYESVNRERQRLEALLEHSADGMMILDADLSILSFNHALERMTGWNAADAAGHSHDDVFNWRRLDSSDLNEALANGWPFNVRRSETPASLYVEGDLIRSDGLPISMAITYAPLFSDEGKLINIIANVRDISAYRKAQEMQNVFVSGISHELKTPVTLIKGYAGTLRREDAHWNREIVRQSAKVIEEEADRLTELINNLLAASRLQAQGMGLECDDVRLDHVAQQAVERFQTQTANHDMVLNFPQRFPAVQADEARLRQVLDNLLSNAIKYSPEGGRIEVGGHFDERNVTVYVRDEGVGLPLHEQEHIFERFYRVDGALSRKTQGTGLGLYLAKAIVEAHGGRMRVDSAPGKGATFSFMLPR